MKKKIAIITSLALLITCFSAVPASAASSKNLIHRVGDSTKSVKVGQEFELEVRKGSNVKDSNIKWFINNTNIVKFDDSDRTDDDIDLKAVKAGTTKVYCKNYKTGGKLVYTVKVSKDTGKIYISKVGNSTKSVYKGGELELSVKKGAELSDDQIKWTISNTSILAYDDDRYGDDLEVVAKKVGTTKVTAHNLKTGGKLVYTVKVKKAPSSAYISRIGSSSRLVELGDDEEITVKKGSAMKQNQIKWVIEDENILGFEDGDNYGNEIELVGKQLGTTKVTVYNLVTGGSLVYTVQVVPDYDD